MMYSYVFFMATILLVLRLVSSRSFEMALLSLDTLTNLIALYLVIVAIYTNETFWIDVAIVFALFSFVGVMAIAKHAVSRDERVE